MEKVTDQRITRFKEGQKQVKVSKTMKRRETREKKDRRQREVLSGERKINVSVLHVFN